jgi:sulfite reductase alpha subunit-like flavoprotein
MERHWESVWAVIKPGTQGRFYVCGEAGKMAKDVHRMLHSVVQRATGCSKGEAEATVKALSDSGRYLKDVW